MNKQSLSLRDNTHPLQSSEWESFRKKWGNETVRVDGNLLTLHKVPLLNKKIAIFEKGPEPNQPMLTKLKDFGQSHNLIFIKLEPNVEKSNSVIQLLSNSGAIPGKTIFTPTTFQIDLTKSEDELMKSFSAKTRYNIRLAIKKGVTIKEDPTAFEKYLELTKETTQRDRFYAHSEKYHRLMWKSLKDKIAHLLVARYPPSPKATEGHGNSEIIVAWILFAYDGVLYYPYGASTHKYKNVMANNLMMWEAIRWGKKHHLKNFDLWGREPGKGFTKFKEGYNPKVVEFIGTWDLIINRPLYYVYLVMDKIRWQILRLKSKFVRPNF